MKSNQKLKKIIMGICFMLLLPINIFISAKGWYPNESMYMAISILTGIFFFVGFIIIGFVLTGFDQENTVVTIAGKQINNEDIINRKNMSIKEKIAAFNIIGLVVAILSIPAFLGIILLINEDPLNIFSVFQNVGRAKIFSMIFLVFLINTVYMKIKNIYLGKFRLIMFIISYGLAIAWGYFVTTT